jgi:hypothetical protein
MQNTTPATPPPAKRNHTNAIIISTAAVLIAGIVTAGVVVSNSRDDGESAPTVAKAASAPASSTKSSPSPSPTQETLKFGDTVDIDSDVQSSAAVLAYRDKGVRGLPELLGAGQKWAVVEVKVCNRGAEAFPVTTFVWSLAYEDGARVESAGTNAGALPQPLYPMDAKVPGGDCVRGNIAFQVPVEGRPERVLYSPDSLDEPVAWRVGR